MNAKEQWVNNAMESLDGGGRAVLDPFVREKILQGIDKAEPGQDIVKTGLSWKIAAVILLLISLNVFTMVNYGRSSGNTGSTARSVAMEYFSFIDHYNL
jgi:hypothetical protein